MIKLLYSVGALSLVLAGVPCVLCCVQWRLDAGQDRDVPGRVTMEKGRTEGRGGPRGRDIIASPLVVQATAFALHLNPPKPPAPVQAPARIAPPQPAPRPVASAPKFRLLSTSRHYSEPEKSLALISEPGRGERWIRKGDRLGHLVVENIRDGAIVYRDGNQLQEATVAARQPVELARVVPAPAAAVQMARPDVRLVHAAGRNESEGQFGSDRPEEFERQ